MTLTYIFIISIGFVFLSLLNIFFFSKICFYFQQEKYYFIIKHENKALLQQLSNYDTAVNDTKKFKHDLNNQLTNISYLLQTNKIADSINYIKSLHVSLDNFYYLVNTGNSTIDAILNFKKFICKKRNIDIDVIVDKIPSLKISQTDITSIIANLADNAIEAVLRVPQNKNKILMRLFCYKDYFTIYIKNPCNERPKYLQTSKLDNENHGFGLSIIDSTAKKYGGSLIIDIKDNCFTAIVMIPISVNV